MPISSRGDVRLTMGGEPTFVSIDDYQSAEWNTSALGPQKLIRADDLIQRLRDRFAPGALLHYGQGKWYPGEELPRWAYSLYWRRDGQPIWQNLDLIARGKTTPEPTSLDAQAFAEECRRASRHSRANSCSRSMKIRPTVCSRKARCRRTSIPSNPKLDDPPSAAASCARSSAISPIRPASCCRCSTGTRRPDRGWLSELWRTRRGRLFLIPGDSPIGFRLPLSQLPHFTAADYPHLVPGDPMDEHPPLPAATADRRRAARRQESPPPRPGRAGGTALAGGAASLPAFRCAPR